MLRRGGTRFVGALTHRADSITRLRSAPSVFQRGVATTGISLEARIDSARRLAQEAAGVQNATDDAAARGENGNADAAVMWRTAVAKLEREHGGANLATAVARCNLASELHNANLFAEAVEQHRLAVAVQEQQLGSDHVETAMTYGQLALSLGGAGHHEEAAKLHLSAVNVFKREFGESHLSTATARGNLAFALGCLGMHAQAAEMLRAAVAIFERELGADHPHTATAHRNLTMALNCVGAHADSAAEVSQVAPAKPARDQGDVHGERVAIMLSNMGRHQEAADALQDILEAKEGKFGADHLEIAKTRSSLACVLSSLGRNREAATMLQAVLTVQESKLGAEHVETIETRSNLEGAIFRLRAMPSADRRAAAWAAKSSDPIASGSTPWLAVIGVGLGLGAVLLIGQGPWFKFLESRTSR